uniref:Neurochondrin n=1 Tax=Strigamia maritima TaxID=126957 RepID=T1IIF7_STRMM
MANNAEMYDSCLTSLQYAKSDTEKFAALLLVTKIVKAEDCDRENRRKIFGAIGFDFVNRLLNTNDVPDGCPPYIFKAIGLTLLSCFCMEPDLISHEKMRSKVTDLTELILTCGESSDEQVMINDAMICISSVVNLDINDSRICSEIVPNLVKIIISEKYGCEKCMDMICNLSERMGSVCWKECVDSFDVVMNMFSRKFVNDYSEIKFTFCKKMTVLVPSCPYGNSSDKTWCDELRKGLSEVFYSKVSLPQLHPSLMLTTAMIEKFGVNWTFGENNKFFLIFAQLTCIEVRMIVEDRNLQQVIEVGPLLVSCFTSLENIIAVLINNVQEIDFIQRQQLYTALTATMNGVLYFLTNESTGIDTLDDLSAMEKQVMFSCVRVIGAWLAEETSALREDVYAILPFIIQITVFDNSSEKDSLNILRFLLPGMCHLTAEDKSRHILIGLKFHEILFDYMLKTWKLFTSTTDDDEYKDSLITTCGIFMNLIVLDVTLVANDKMFDKLLRFVFGALPELENKAQNLVLIGNLSVIGLLLFRYYANKMKYDDNVIDIYLSSCITFLSGAHDIEASDASNSLVVAQEYRGVWTQIEELYFLGIQALSTLLKELPRVGKLILESGWISVILKTLKKIEAGAIDAGTKNVVEYLLCSLVPTEKCVQQILVDEGGSEICVRHEMKELKKLLLK